MRNESWRNGVVALTALFILAPVGLILWQSFLTDAFFNARSSLTTDTYAFVLGDPGFWAALRNTVTLALGMVVIAVPLGSLLAFLMVRTDMPGRKWIEPAIFLPLFMSPMVLAFGYIVSIGPSGFWSVWWENTVGPVFWNVYSMPILVLVVGLTHVPHVYIYVSTALRTVPSDLEEAARVAGGTPLTVATRVTLPLVWPSIAVSAVLVAFLGFELFGLPYVLGDQDGRLVLATYLYKYNSLLGRPAYQLMAVVVVFLMLVTLPLVLLQRRMLRSAQRYSTIGGKATRSHLVPLGPWKWVAFAGVMVWLYVVVLLPLSGVALRSLVTTWGPLVDLRDVLTLDNYRKLTELPLVRRSIVNTLLLAFAGGFASLCVYALIGLASHRSQKRSTRALDFLVLLPRAMPGIVAGLVVFWIFLFLPLLRPFVASLVAMWVAYTLVWLPFGLRLVSNSFGQVGRELEEAAHVAGAGTGRVARDVILPLARHGLMAAWLLAFLLYAREYSTGIFLMGQGNEVMGTMLVSLWNGGNIDIASSLAVVNTLVIAGGIALALRLGVRLDA
ncbi:ABC transporter permease [Paracoccus yeei]|uniref:Iron ABC transporter permease n=1 Tax=Paracoccus yeei TaxID=147645 RepID=A0A5P2QMV7_9RHOB|nr:iron ABC transporter permease [Paracoccus yeei]OWJ88986.1 iron ABC transporter permease [Paracoccus yeei]QEU06816.1 iron ABC transporter permease [Paracoccus yeei]